MKSSDYVTHELAVKLKEAGFCGTALGKYVDYSNDPVLLHGMEYQSWNLEKNEILAPLLSHAQKWLREVKKIDVLVYNCACGYLWEVSKAANGTGLILFDENGDDKDSGCWITYEGALSAGIEAALDLL